jgi:hypothetical protein
MTEKERNKRLQNETIYLRNEFEDIVLRSTPGEKGKFYVKFPGESEYEIAHSTNLVTETLLEWDEITEEEYKNH